MRPNRLTKIILVLFLLFFIFAPLFSGGIDLIVDWLWFKQEGFAVLYLTMLEVRLGLSSYAGLGFMAVVGANLLIARALAKKSGHRVYQEIIEFPALDRLSEIFGWVVWIGVLFLGYVVSQWAMTHWRYYLLNEHVQRMNLTDPIFNIDLGFYLFQLPYHWFLYHLALITVIACIVSAAFLYLIQGGVWVTPQGPSVSRHARAHLIGLTALVFVLFAYRARLALYGLLYSPVGVVYGAGYTDVHATLPVLEIVLVLCLVTALALLFAAWTDRFKIALGTAGLLAAVALIGMNVYPAIIQHLVVTPNELDKEEPYIARAIDFTRKAYALDRFEEHQFSANEDLTLGDIEKNDATMRNVRLWDHKPLLTTFAQLQEIRTYYDFASVDNDRYWINGNYRQVSLSARELSSANLPGRNWINEHLIYTHGYGLCMSPVNEYTPDGLPVLFIKDIPPVSTVPIKITRPEIYYGEMPNDYCFVKTGQQEFDYPAGDHDVYTTYSGAGGIPVGGFWRRVLFALKFGEKNILFSTDIGPQSRLMIYRQILERARRLTPFLRYDSDPYMVISKDGELYWMLDGYTLSSQYPYSDPTEDVGNYIRNSVKATVNAFTGQVNFYISDPTDPLIQAYSEIFPGVFKPLDDMPEDLRAHIRYPEGFFSIQAAKYAVFHMTDPRVFFNKEDLWRVARSIARGPGSPMTPYYTIMKLAEVGKTEEFILMVPFTPARKDNMIAWMAARCDTPNYGKVMVFTFPKQRLVYGPQQIESRVDQDPTISQQLTLWDQHGSQVIRGTLLVIPVLNSVLYVEPIYLAAQSGGALPQMQRVILAYSDHVVMSPTFDDALSQVFGGAISTAPAASQTASAVASPAKPQPAPQVQDLIRDANQHYQRALELERQGDWAGYGNEIKQLGGILQKLAAQK